MNAHPVQIEDRLRRSGLELFGSEDLFENEVLNALSGLVPTALLDQLVNLFGELIHFVHGTLSSLVFPKERLPANSIPGQFFGLVALRPDNHDYEFDVKRAEHLD